MGAHNLSGWKTTRFRLSSLITDVASLVYTRTILHNL